MIRKADFENEKYDILSVIWRAFLTVAEEFHLTKENAPSNAAFLPIESLEEQVQDGLEIFVAIEDDVIVGAVGIEPGKKKRQFYIEKLAVLPEWRHRKIGEKLLLFAIEKIKEQKAKEISIGIINDNHALKQWYLKLGFEEREIKKFDNLPFDVCLMDMEV